MVAGDLGRARTRAGHMQQTTRTAGRRTSFEGILATAAAMLLLVPIPARAADITAREITTRLYQASDGAPIDLSGKDLRFLNLSGLDFKAARLAGCDLYGADLTGSRLNRSDLSGSRLDHAVLVRADLSGANLAGATLLRPAVSATLPYNMTDSPRFPGANLKRVRVMAHFEGVDFRGADLTGADFSPFEPRAGQKAPSTAHGNVCKSCDFSGARLVRVDFSHAALMFSRFNGADLSASDLSEADLSRADLTGANLTGADLTGADLDGAILIGARGLDSATGLLAARNLDRASR